MYAINSTNPLVWGQAAAFYHSFHSLLERNSDVIWYGISNRFVRVERLLLTQQFRLSDKSAYRYVAYYSYIYVASLFFSM